MRKRIVTVAICLGLLSGCTAWKKKGGWSGATGGEEFVRLWWADVKAKRTSELEKRMAATYLGVSPQGVVDRAGALQHLGEMELQEYSLGDFVTQANGDDLVVAYRATFNGSIAGRPLQVSGRYLSVWQPTKHGWLLIAESATPEQTP